MQPDNTTPKTTPEPPPSTSDPKIQAIQRVKEANNVLVTVSTNPTTDQLAGALALTLLLNKLGKHSVAVFSGEVPSNIAFLHPEKTIEPNTDSLRDFIISLDKAKADKLRYKVEDKVVKIFITPYKTSITEADLQFSQGDFNIDAVVALGVHSRGDLDQAITAQGRILHDATVISVNNQQASDLGSINWLDNKASSLCEMILDIGEGIGSSLDTQIATALLSGIVVETERFSNQKTTPQTMSASAKLMAAGANQQLVASELESKPTEVVKTSESEETKPPVESKTDEAKVPATTVLPKAETASSGTDDKGAMVIDHNQYDQEARTLELPTESELKREEAVVADALEGDLPDEDKVSQIEIDRDGVLHKVSGKNSSTSGDSRAVSKMITEPPAKVIGEGEELGILGSEEQGLTPSEPGMPLLNRPGSMAESQAPVSADPDEQTLKELEAEVNKEADTGNSSLPSATTENVRQTVNQVAIGMESPHQEPLKALNSNPIDLNLDHKDDDHKNDQSEDKSDELLHQPPPASPPPLMLPE